MCGEIIKLVKSVIKVFEDEIYKSYFSIRLIQMIQIVRK